VLKIELRNLRGSLEKILKVQKVKVITMKNHKKNKMLRK
jgi:hypothetical protein